MGSPSSRSGLIVRFCMGAKVVEQIDFHTPPFSPPASPNSPRRLERARLMHGMMAQVRNSGRGLRAPIVPARASALLRPACIEKPLWHDEIPRVNKAPRLTPPVEVPRLLRSGCGEAVKVRLLDEKALAVL